MAFPRNDRAQKRSSSGTFHECRHAFAPLLIDAGVNPKALQEFMGHATIEETFSRGIRLANWLTPLWLRPARLPSPHFAAEAAHKLDGYGRS